MERLGHAEAFAERLFAVVRGHGWDVDARPAFAGLGVIVTASKANERTIEVKRDAITVAALDVARRVGEIEAARPAVQLQLEVA